MPKKRVNLIGQTFGFLEIIDKAEDIISGGRARTQWKCKCIKCGNETVVQTNNLKNGHTQSCGCLKKEKNSKKNTYKELAYCMVGYTQEGKEFYFDKEDYDKIKSHYWSINNLGYVQSVIKGKITLFHRFVLNPPKNKVIDHINHNRNDNRRENLRIVTDKENCENRKITNRNTSGVVGVFWSKAHNKWIAHIGSKRKKIVLGHFKNFEDAVKAKKQAEKELFEEISNVSEINKE